MVIFKCYFSGELIALSINKNNNGVNIALGKTNRLDEHEDGKKRFVPTCNVLDQVMKMERRALCQHAMF